MKTLPIALLVTVLTAGCAGPVDNSATQTAWIDLFNGRDFSGWTFDVKDGSPPDTIWSVEDGVLVTNGQDKSNGVIRSEASYGDYELELEWRWPGKPGNSGCLIHCSTPREMSVWPRSIEIQLGNGNAGDLIHIGETIETPEAQIPTGDIKAWEVRRRYNLTDDSENPAGEWNHLRIVARGDEVTVFVNDDLVNHGTKATAKDGAICLQTEGADIQFRSIRIRDLP